MFIFICFLFVRACLAIMVVASGAAKLVDRTSFAQALILLGAPVHRKKAVQSLAITISIMELLLGEAILSGLWSVAINALLLATMGSFSLVVVFALRKAPQASCRCFGALSNSQFSQRGLVRNLLFTVAALFVFVSSLYFSMGQIHEAPLLILLPTVGSLFFAFVVAQAAKVVSRTAERVVA